MKNRSKVSTGTQHSIHDSFSRRRASFLKQIQGGVALFCSPPEFLRNPDVHFPFRQDSNLYYLTGFEEPKSAALFAPATENPFQIFVRPKDKTKELWDGRITGPDKAKEQVGADRAFPSEPENYLEAALIDALCASDRLYYRVGLNSVMDQRVFSCLEKAARKLGRTGRSLWPILDPNQVLGEMRVIKERYEIDRMAAAAQMTAEAHLGMMKLVRPGMYEYEVEAALYHGFRVQGAQRVGYDSIVASGPNACVLHYRNNDRQMTDKDLLLIDAGAELDYYCADITRCFPVGPRFSGPQREVYEAVLTAQKSCLKMVRPGKTMDDIHEHAVEVLVEELKKLKILKGPSRKLIQDKVYSAYYPHRTGHWLGMDVHDVGLYLSQDLKGPRKLEAGMVLTVEPGLYFSANSDAPAKYKGIGVRIEDDVLVVSGGSRVLTSGVSKEIEEIEAFRNTA